MNFWSYWTEKMKSRVLIIIGIGIIIFTGVGYAGAETYFHLSAHTECFEMGKIPVFDKFGNDQYMVSCMNINPFENWGE